MSKCWKCNKEFYSENLIRTLCDECLEKIPKTTATTDFGNLLNSEIKDLVDDFSKRKISELEAKLAEEKEYTRQYRKECAKIQTDYYELKQQLHDLPKKIVEEIKEKLFNHFKVKNIEEYEKLPLIDSLFTADTVIEFLDTILKKYGVENE